MNSSTPTSFIRTLAPKAREPLDVTAFYELADAVLSGTGRPSLAATQRSIIEVRDSDLVLQILAGPGAGKTEVLVWRVLYELLVRGTDPTRVMVTTFTRKAAQELEVRMVERSDGLLEAALARGLTVEDPRVHDLRIGTIHALCDELLTEFDVDHMEQGNEVIDEVETKLRFLQSWRYVFKRKGGNLLKDILDVPELTSLFMAPWETHVGGIKQVDLALAIINQHIETWLPRCLDSNTPNGIETLVGRKGLTDDLTSIRKRWAVHLEQDHAIDYALLLRRFLQGQPKLSGILDHVFVDEFQDTNPIQYAIHKKWPEEQGVRLTVVGDDDQALYRWRGSDIGCFDNLQPDCSAAGLAYRRELLKENNRSSARIVAFAGAFRETTVLSKDSLPKTIVSPKGKAAGDPVRLIEGDWSSICERVAEEINALGAGRILQLGEPRPPTVAILMASTSEVESKASARPALDMRRALEARGLRVYNPRNKAAARPGSPVHDLMGLISYLIDPVTKGPAGKLNKNGERRRVEVWASCHDELKESFAVSAPPPFPIYDVHASIQKRVLKGANGSVESPDPRIAPLLGYLDDIRESLVSEPEDKVRLTLGGLVARLLAAEPFRSSGYTVQLFRQALFTQLLDANIAVTRTQGKKSLERPMVPRRRPDGKIEWPPQYWSMLSLFGQLIAAGGQDDLEVEAFSEDSISLLTYHQAKGLEFDHVYVAMTGKEVEPSSVLATMLFSGETPNYEVAEERPKTKDRKVMRRATADREREVYVAITRAKDHLTVLNSPKDRRPMMKLNAGIADLFKGTPSKKSGHLTIKSWTT